MLSRSLRGDKTGSDVRIDEALLAAWTTRARWSRGWRIWFVLLVFWPIGVAVGQPAAPPEQAWQTRGGPVPGR